MKSLNLEQMEKIEGGGLASFGCGLLFIGVGGLVGGPGGAIVGSIAGKVFCYPTKAY